MADLRNEFDQIRRSASIGHGLTRADTERLLDLVDALLTERAEVRQLLDQLGPPWRVTRETLNRLHSMVR